MPRPRRFTPAVGLIMAVSILTACHGRPTEPRAVPTIAASGVARLPLIPITSGDSRACVAAAPTIGPAHSDPDSQGLNPTPTFAVTVAPASAQIVWSPIADDSCPAAVELADSALAAEIAAAIDDLEVDDERASFACGSARTGHADVYFDYSSGRTELVTISDSGCGTVAVSGATAPRVVSQALVTLLPATTVAEQAIRASLL